MTVSGPLSGLVILDLTRVLAGPYCTMLLSDLGARIVKVEPPEGDDSRRYGPFIEGTSGYFTAFNRGKESIVIDLKTLKVVKSFDVPQQPGEILIRPDAAVAYITCMPAGKIAVLDLRTWQLQPTIDLTPGVDGMAWSASN